MWESHFCAHNTRPRGRLTSDGEENNHNFSVPVVTFLTERFLVDPNLFVHLRPLKYRYGLTAGTSLLRCVYVGTNLNNRPL